MKLRCFLKKFTQLTKILHDRRSRRSRQIPSLLPKSFKGIHFIGKWIFDIEKESVFKRTKRVGIRAEHCLVVMAEKTFHPEEIFHFWAGFWPVQASP